MKKLLGVKVDFYHMNISAPIFSYQGAHNVRNLIFFFRPKDTVTPVYLKSQKGRNYQIHKHRAYVSFCSIFEIKMKIAGTETETESMFYSLMESQDRN